MTVFLGTLWSAIKQIKAPYIFYCEQALRAIQGNWASSHSEGKSVRFSRVVVGTWGVFLSNAGDRHSKLVFVQ